MRFGITGNRIHLRLDLCIFLGILDYRKSYTFTVRPLYLPRDLGLQEIVYIYGQTFVSSQGFGITGNRIHYRLDLCIFLGIWDYRKSYTFTVRPLHLPRVFDSAQICYRLCFPLPNATTGSGNTYPFGIPPVFSGVHVDRFLVFCVMFCRSLLVFFGFFSPLYCRSFFDLQILIIHLVS